MILQKETGSALVFAAFLLPLYRQGMTGKIMGSGVVVAIVFVLVLKLGWIPDSVMDKVFEPHQKTRIEVLLGIKEDPTGAGYNVNQSLIAIGSGGFAGKGYLKGTQTKMKFVPEQTEQNPTPLGRWARERKKYLMEQRKPIYENMVLSETLLPHLREIDRTAEETMETLMTKLPAEAGATETLKAQNPMQWTGIMNNCRAQAEEMIRAELIYA